MAPQQNSTLIDDNLEKIPSLINICERESYSPILPPQKNLHNRNNYENNNKCHKNEPTQRAIIYDNRKRQKNKNAHRTEGNHCSRSQRCRSVSLNGVNSAMELGHKEIPIWLDDEPRYVSGVTNKTTCNDVVKALLDDEFRSGNCAYCLRGPDGAASRDYNDYVITESWRGIERSYDGNMAILPVWKAWSRVHNELRFSLKHRSQEYSSSRNSQPQRRFTAFRKYFIKLLRFAIKTKTKEIKTVEQQKNRCLVRSQNKIPDEFFFVLLPDNLNNAPHTEDGKSNHFTHTVEESSKQTDAKFMNNKLFENYKLYCLSETTSTKKRHASSRRCSKDKGTTDRRRSALDSNSCIKRSRDVPNRNSIRNQLAQKTGKVNHLYDREYALTKQLTSKCKLYKLHNYLYLEPEKHLEVSVGEIQRNVEKHAEEIIKTEHELLEVKNEIKQDISIINNLKRLTLSNKKCIEVSPPEAPIPAKEARVVAPAAKGGDEHMQFVDNIYEFCDNNASMLV